MKKHEISYNIKKYRCNGQFINSVDFRDEIIKKLSKYHYASAKNIAKLLKARVPDVEEAIKDIIVIYCRQNKNQTMRQICDALFVKSLYIIELCDEGRLEINTNISEQEKKYLTNMEEISDEKNKLLMKQEVVKELSQAFSSYESKSNLSNGYHYLEKGMKKK